jgi:hypothetical protein
VPGFVAEFKIHGVEEGAVVRSRICCDSRSIVAWQGYEDVNDAERLSQDPTFRLIGSEKIWERGAALPSHLHWFETEVLGGSASTRNRAPTGSGEGSGVSGRCRVCQAEIYEVLEDDSGLLLVRELDERLELSALIAANIIGRPLA